MMVQPDSNRFLKEFGIAFGVITLVIFGFFLPWILEQALPLWPWVASICICVLALSKPRVLKPVYIVFASIGGVLAKIASFLILVLLFFFLMIPIALVRKVFAEDPVVKKFDKNLNTYFQEPKKRDAKHMEKPY